MASLLLIFLFQWVTAQTYTDPASDPAVLTAFPRLPGCARYAVTTGIAGYFTDCVHYSIANWTCVCSTNYVPTLSSLIATYCPTHLNETQNVTAATSVFADFCSQLTAFPPITSSSTMSVSSVSFSPTTSHTTSPLSTTSGAPSSKKLGLGLGLGFGLGVPILLAAAFGIWFVRGGKKKPLRRVEPVEQQKGEPIHLGRM